MTWDALLLSAHAFATLALVGLIWTIQVVHYPLFARVGDDAWVAYERAHVSRITVVVGPLMLAEAATAAALLLLAPAGVPRWMPIAGATTIVVIWISTAIWQSPLHMRLARSFDAGAHRELVLGNWVRTVLWTGRGVLALGMLHAHLALRPQAGGIA